MKRQMKWALTSVLALLISCMMAAVCVAADETWYNPISLTQNTTVSNLTVESGVTVDLNGYTLTVTGSLNTKGILNVTGGGLRVVGDLTMSSGEINVAKKGSVTVEHSIYQSAGTILLNDGTLSVAQNYVQAKYNASSNVYSVGSGCLKMHNDADVVKIGGDYHPATSKGSGNSNAGRMEIGGNVINDATSSQATLQFPDTVVFTGSKAFTIQSNNASSTEFYHVTVENASRRTWTIAGSVGIVNTLELGSDALSVQTKDWIFWGDALQGKNVTIQGNVTCSGGSWIIGTKEVVVNGNFRQSGGSITLGGARFVVKGNMETAGDFTLNAQGSLDVGGDLHQTAGTVLLNNGKLHVAGDYIQAVYNIATGLYGNGTGSLSMVTESDEVTIDGDYHVNSRNAKGTQTKGVIRIGGNFRNYSDRYAYQSSNTVIFATSSALTLDSSAGADSEFGTVQILNTKTITCKGTVGVASKLDVGTSTDIAVTSKDWTFWGEGLNNKNVTVNGSMSYRSGSWMLNGKKLNVTGDFHQLGGTVNLGGGSVTVTGGMSVAGDMTINDAGRVTINKDLNHTGGTILLNHGALAITGTYIQAKYNQESSLYERCTACLEFHHDADTVTIGGDYRMNSSKAEGYQNKGVIQIGGNFRNYGSSSATYASANTVRFTGTDALLIDSDHGASSEFGTVLIENASKRTINIKGSVGILTKLNNDGDSLTVVATTWAYWGDGLSRKDVTVKGDMEYSSGTWMLEGKRIAVDGNFTQTGGTINLGGGTLTVNKNLAVAGDMTANLGSSITVSGDMSHTKGTLLLNNGKLKVTGNYIESNYKASMDSYSGCSAYFQMTNDADYVTIGGNYLVNSRYAKNQQTKGTIEIGGNFKNIGESSSYAYQSSNTVIFTKKDAELTLDSSTGADSEFGTIRIPNTKKITCKGSVGVLSLLDVQSTDIAVASKNWEFWGDGLSGKNVTVNGSMSYRSGSWMAEGKTIVIHGSFTQNGGSINLAKGVLKIDGDGKVATDDELSLVGGTVTVGGDFYHETGTVNFGGGTMNVKGNYTQSAYNEATDTYSTSSSRLQMVQASDVLTIGGNYRTDSSVSHSDLLTAGKIYLAGDFYQRSGNQTNFAASGTHQVILNGTRKQKIHFDSLKSAFNYLKLIQAESQYTFDPDKCWTKLVGEKVSLDGATITLSATKYTYDGAEKTPVVNVKYGSVLLLNETDYTVSYSNNVNAGTATVIVTGKGDFIDRTTRDFTIDKAVQTLAADIPVSTLKVGATTKVQISGAQGSLHYSSAKPSVADVDSSGTVIAVGVGTTNIRVSADETANYKAASAKSISVTVTQGNLSVAEVSLGRTSYIYSGNANQPSVTVRVNGAKLAEGTDYTVSYVDNTNVGTAKVVLTGIGNYTGVVTKTFTVKTRSIGNAKATLAYSKCTYTGNPRVPAVKIEVGSKVLKSGTDYTAVYRNNVNVGTASVVITGKGNYSGTLTKTFQINPKGIALSGLKTSLSYTKCTYSGNYKKPIVTVKRGSTTLKKGTDYTVSYRNNVSIGTATVVITGKGAYSGTVSKTFKINPMATSISSATNLSTKRIKVTWNRNSTATGYYVQYSTSSKFYSSNTTTIRSGDSTSRTISGLTKGKTYYVRIQTYRTVNGKNYYSNWSSSKKLKIEK